MLRVSLLACCLIVWAAVAGAQTTIPIDVHTAFLHLDPQDAAGNAVAIDLSSLGLAPGYTIKLQSTGDWNAGPGGDVQTALLGVFSSSSTLLDRSLLHRVPGALDAGLYNYSGPTWPSGEPTDIAEDFVIGNPGVTVVIPAGATHLFVTVADIYYTDNSDPDGDLGVTITLVRTASVGPWAAPRPIALAAAPNPFSNATSFAFRLDAPGPARLTIHDVSGRRIRTLLEASLDAGDHFALWDGRDDAGRPVPVGSYFGRLDTGREARATRLIRIQ